MMPDILEKIYKNYHEYFRAEEDGISFYQFSGDKETILYDKLCRMTNQELMEVFEKVYENGFNSGYKDGYHKATVDNLPLDDDFTMEEEKNG